MKACKDCKWYRREGYLIDSIDVCGSEQANYGDPDYLNGKPSEQQHGIAYMRSKVYLCGHDAKLFEPKEEPPTKTQ